MSLLYVALFYVKVEVCHVFFTLDVQYTGLIEHAQASNASSTEQPTCPVCLGMLFFVYLVALRPCIYLSV